LADLADEAKRRRGPRRIFYAFLVLSAALHAGALVMAPQLARDADPPGPPRLEVVILRPEPLPAAPPAAARAVPQEAKRGAHTAPRELRLRQEFSTAGAERPLLSEEHDPAPSGRLPDRVASVSERLAQPDRAPAPASSSASYLSNPPPQYPGAARRAGEQGTVMLRVQITREGMAQRVSVERSSGSAHLDNAALDAVRGWRFNPARRGAETVEEWMLVPVVFRLEAAL
jgi:protein TonB